MLAAAQPAAAVVHQWAWTASGVAAGPDGPLAMTVRWTGGFTFFPGCSAEYIVTLTDPDGASAARRFRGYEAQTAVGQGALQESFLTTGGSTDPAVAFTYRAAQVNTLLPVRSMNNALVGTYIDLAFVAATVNHPFSTDPCA
ncbi:MAG TPA: hypothetical protein VGR28_15180 [Candidatus Thermoplasmatota archaeon]|jgi:hypothetical protein|nr:hypothetical protein [Candidatus Thermoplasmatota archaeon]